MDTRENKVYYKDQEVKYNITQDYYFIDTDQGMIEIEYCAAEDRWYECRTGHDKKGFQYKLVTPAFVFAHGERFSMLQDPEKKNLIKSLKILRNLNADCAHVQYKQDSDSDINDQVKVLHDFCQTLSPETMNFFNKSLVELCYVTSPYNCSTFTDDFFTETLLDIFETGSAEDLYDVDMFIHDVTERFIVCLGAETQVVFQSALIDFVRKHEPYEHFGSSGLFIIVAELTEWAKDNF